MSDQDKDWETISEERRLRFAEAKAKAEEILSMINQIRLSITDNEHFNLGKKMLYDKLLYSIKEIEDELDDQDVEGHVWYERMRVLIMQTYQSL